MFSNKSKDNVAMPLNIGPAPIPPKRVSRTGSVPSIVSADLTVTGTLNTSGDMQIDGILEGDVRSSGLVIGERAEVHGQIWAEDVTIRGRVIGRIHAHKALLCATSHVEGDILAEAFAVEAGAFFEGSCKHSDNPLGDDDKKGLQTVLHPVQPAQNGRTSLTPLQTTDV
jgi:cytoskeletal protein CcmA (bactofilin family)